MAPLPGPLCWASLTFAEQLRRHSSHFDKIPKRNFLGMHVFGNCITPSILAQLFVNIIVHEQQNSLCKTMAPFDFFVFPKYHFTTPLPQFIFGNILFPEINSPWERLCVFSFPNCSTFIFTAKPNFPPPWSNGLGKFLLFQRLKEINSMVFNNSDFLFIHGDNSFHWTVKTKMLSHSAHLW